MGKKWDWEVSARFNYGSAFPFTQTQTFTENMNFSGGIGTDYLTQNGSLNIVYADKINGGRLSDYHRLDLSMKKKFSFGKFCYCIPFFLKENFYQKQKV